MVKNIKLKIIIHLIFFILLAQREILKEIFT